MSDPNKLWDIHTDKQKEYLRRNRVLSKAYGVRADILYSLERGVKRMDCPQWLITKLQHSYDIMGEIIKELVKHRKEEKGEK
jgi:hypothetical protein